MARIFTAGIETKRLDEFWTAQADVLSFPSGRISGTAALFRGGPGADAKLPNLTEFYLRFAFYQPWTTKVEHLQIMDTNFTKCIYVMFQRMQPIEVYVSGTATPVIVTNDYVKPSWNLFEMHVVYAETGGLIEVRLDGGSIEDYSGATKLGAWADYLGFIRWRGTGSGDLGLDDVAINDTSGGADNDWCGDGHVVGLIPNANGDASDFMGSDGNQVNNYQLVDEFPSDGNTTYVESDALNAKDLYHVSDVSMKANDAVKRVWVAATAMELSGDGDELSLGLKSDTTEDWDTGQALGISYRHYRSKDYNSRPQGGAWEEADLNDLQVGMKVV